MTSAVLSKASSYLTNPNNFVKVGYLATTSYLALSCVKDTLKWEDSSTLTSEFGSSLPHHVTSILSQGALAAAILSMSQTSLIAKSHGYISQKLGTRFLPSAHTLAATLLILKVVDISLHALASFSNTDNSSLRKKLIQLNFGLSSAFLTTLALTALTQFQNWKEGLGSFVLFGSLFIYIAKPVLSSLPEISSVPLIPHLILGTTAVAGKIFKKLSFLPKAQAIMLIIACSLVNIAAKTDDLP